MTTEITTAPLSVTVSWVLQFKNRAGRFEDSSYRPFPTKGDGEEIARECFDGIVTRVIKRTVTDELA